MRIIQDKLHDRLKDNDEVSIVSNEVKFNENINVIVDNHVKH